VDGRSRRHGVEALILAAIVLIAACSAGPALEVALPYRACLEHLGQRRHDTGVVVWIRDGDDGRTHYGFRPDRLRYDDPREVLDVVEDNGVVLRRSCPAVGPAIGEVGNSAESSTPISVEGPRPRE